MMRLQFAQLRTPTNNVIIQLMALMFFSSIGRGLVAPYINLYLSDLGTTGATIGLIAAIASLVELSFSPYLNNLADKHNHHRVLLMAQYACFSIGAFLLAFSTDVYVLAAIVILIELGKRSAIILSLQLSMIRLEEVKRNYLGRIRAFNAVGFSVANIFQGAIFLATGFVGMFFTSSIFMALTIWFTRVLPKQITTRKKNEEVAPRNRKFYILVLTQVLVQLGLRSGFTFWLIHLTKNLGMNFEDVGLILAITAMSEAPFFVLFDSIVRRIDVRITYMLGASGMAVFWLLLAIVPSPGWIIPILFARGLAFALFNLSILILISRISDPRNVATNQSLLQITVPGLSVLFGAPLMGWIYDHYEAWTYFGLCAVLMFAGVMVMVIMYRWMAPKKMV